ncbi:6-phosphogluconolactonase [Solimicrobium silvestre]|uniref:6-phosphogluconolactonase/Glucosamine-6-phosphate isomerase/deaminase n=1 Tax=Solimicrobium silvestre TaxID=2099400 RepID=A0A2S9H3D5_9BURK|nr:6-phosphogluconolactonase [Solimicrobium silvestre]PRC94488.1 6-phosphogluconolactonase/Glucosamine-6-phosphate isomerase/deaminase [Solimicrobium silvestre]
MLRINEYSDFASLSHELANKWLALVTSTPANQPCSFALAGGSTPAPLYRQFDSLFAAAKPRSIQLIATDERWVPDADPQSNEGLFRNCFSESAALWKLVSLKNELSDPASAAPYIHTRLQEQCDHTFSAVILGMGTDGHIASLFPDAPQLLIADDAVNCVAALHPQTQQARMSLSFSRLLATQSIWLVITGAEKRAVLENSSAPSPVNALLAAARCDVEVFWCP